jgi:hypothetical protein
MSGFEEKYRRRNPDAAPVAADTTPAIEVLKAAAETTDEYKAYNAVPHPKRKLWVRPNGVNPFTDVGIPYSCCNHMISDGSGFVISLHFNTPIICVTLQGRNLNDLFRKLLDDEVEWVMEFDARKWPTPGEHEPCITGIEVTHAPLPQRRSDDDALAGEKRVAKVASH